MSALDKLRPPPATKAASPARKKAAGRIDRITHDGQSQVTLGDGTTVYVPYVWDSVACEQLRKQVLEEFVPIDKQLLSITMYGKTVYPRRRKMFQGNHYMDGSTPHYKYTADHVPPTSEWTPAVLQIRDTLSALTQHPELSQYNTHCVLNHYVTQDDYIGGHVDKMRSAEHNSHILTVSLGAPRIMRFTELANKRNQVDLLLQPGSLLRLSYTTNELWTHEILPGEADRVSLTYRYIRDRMLPNGRITRDLPAEWDLLIATSKTVLNSNVEAAIVWLNSVSTAFLDNRPTRGVRLQGTNSFAHLREQLIDQLRQLPFNTPEEDTLIACSDALQAFTNRVKEVHANK